MRRHHRDASAERPWIVVMMHPTEDESIVQIGGALASKRKAERRRRYWARRIPRVQEGEIRWRVWRRLA